MDDAGDPDAAARQGRPWYDSELAGAGLILLVNLVLALSGWWFGLDSDSGTGLVLLVGIGAVQVLWLVPLLVLFRKRRRLYVGLLVGAGVTLLLNGGCWALVGNAYGSW